MAGTCFPSSSLVPGTEQASLEARLCDGHSLLPWKAVWSDRYRHAVDDTAGPEALSLGKPLILYTGISAYLVLGSSGFPWYNLGESKAKTCWWGWAGPRMAVHGGTAVARPGQRVGGWGEGWTGPDGARWREDKGQGRKKDEGSGQATFTNLNICSVEAKPMLN